MEDYERIELRSDDVQEILGTPPKWIVRWGTSVLFLGLGFLLIVSWQVKYPDEIQAPLSVSTFDPPVPVVARSTGYLAELQVKDGDIVNAGDLLVVLQNTAKYQDVLFLERELNRLDSMNAMSIVKFKPKSGLFLGDLQPTYSVFVQLLKEYAFKKNENFGNEHIRQLERQKFNLEQLIFTEREKMRTLDKNLAFAKQRLKDRQGLYNQPNTPISRNELERASEEVLMFEREYKNVQINIKQFEGNSIQIDKSILEIQQNTKEGNTTKYVGLVENLHQLKTGILRWKQTYLLTAPIDGKVSFFNNYWATHQNIKETDQVMAIVPQGDGTMIGQVALPMFGSGKVRAGQRVKIKFDSYPYQEFGLVDGIVDTKSLLPKDNTSISVRVRLPNGLKTSYNKTLPFDQQMQGTAEIITEDRRFIERVFDKLISAFKNH
jgi:multidrug resistance efflux pump